MTISFLMMNKGQEPGIFTSAKHLDHRLIDTALDPTERALIGQWADSASTVPGRRLVYSRGLLVAVEGECKDLTLPGVLDAAKRLAAGYKDMKPHEQIAWHVADKLGGQLHPDGGVLILDMEHPPFLAVKVYPNGEWHLQDITNPEEPRDCLKLEVNIGKPKEAGVQVAEHVSAWASGKVLTPPVLWVQKWTESEAGWGQRPDGYTLHRDKADIQPFLKGLSGQSRDCYSRPEGSPYQTQAMGDIGVLDRLDEAYAEGGHGLWGPNGNNYPKPLAEGADQSGWIQLPGGGQGLK